VTRFALITAAGKGLGAAIAEHLEATGFTVFSHYKRSVPRAGIAVQADLRTAAGRIAVIDRVRAETERLDVLVNNLGVYSEEHTLPEIGLEEFEEVLTLTLTSAFHITQLSLDLLQEGSRVINIGDSGCDRIEARVFATPYHIAKLGLHVLTRSHAKALTSRGITVNMISPGFLENSIGAPTSPIPAGRPGFFSDVIPALDFLLSKEAGYVSGTNLLVNGGWNLG
jgi:NAD(P)-dependent dehydrogenase (short-subunit alcohol dehydrogenase family)